CLLSLLAVGGCSSATRPTAGPSSTAHAPAPSRGSLAMAQEIDSTIYSDLPKEQMLKKLEPFVAVMDSKADSKKKTGLKLQAGFTSGPGGGVTDHSVEDCGLRLIVDPDQKIRIIRRVGRSIAGRDYPEMSISEPGFKWHGYARWYPN